ncbi:ABC transporter ATP-binding protein [Paenibacillus humicola]|uniref:ABC transporter ATP-binding protein n=1 Tax=Paenibacillus humicola TaxID=3110540 RepID=UPI00237BDB17|nr:ABC transporter ATP-binding protein [Paenibacillus humicola]
MSLIEVDNLSVVFKRKEKESKAVNGVSLKLDPQSTLGIIGESGSGKSVMLRTILGLTRSPNTRIGGSIRFEGKELTAMNEMEYASVRGKEISMIFQDPMTALDPLFTVGYQLCETLMRHQRLSKMEAYRKAEELLEKVGIPSPRSRLGQYPHQMSGGMRQRVMIAIAVACQPSLLLADEPTTALDVTVQAQVLALIKNLQKDSGMGIVFVSHDIGVVASISDEIAVMYAGRVVERGSVRQVLHHPNHPYTKSLIEANVTLGMKGRLKAIQGQPPRPDRLPSGCPFASRCTIAGEECLGMMPGVTRMESGHEVACWAAGEGRSGAHSKVV